eukprot:m.115976 g.115976  ORF g.115976 m.115976 type:complete len:390 (+) comp14222_c0_seq2:96-1265(+)
MSQTSKGMFSLFVSMLMVITVVGEIKPEVELETPLTSRVQLRANDYVGFLRFRKVGSTTMHEFMKEETGLCPLASCVSGKDESCDSSTCLYTIDCSCTPNKREPCYQCAHVSFRDVYTRYLQTTHRFKKQNEAKSTSRLFMVTVVRDPFKRLLSEFFFVYNGACPSVIRDAPLASDNMMIGWLAGYHPIIQHAICSLDFETFATNKLSWAINNQVRQLVGVKNHLEVSKRHCKQAISAIGRVHLVLMQDDLMPKGLTLLNYTFVRGEDATTKRLSAAEILEQNSKLMDNYAYKMRSHAVPDNHVLRETYLKNKELKEEHGASATLMPYDRRYINRMALWEASNEIRKALEQNNTLKDLIKKSNSLDYELLAAARKQYQISLDAMNKGMT